MLGQRKGRGKKKKKTYELLAAVPVAAMEIDDQTSAVQAASLLERCNALNVLVACLVQHVKNSRRRGADGSAGNGSHRLGNIVVRRVEKDKHSSRLIDDMNGAGFVQMGLGQRLHYQHDKIQVSGQVS